MQRTNKAAAVYNANQFGRFKGVSNQRMWLHFWATGAETKNNVLELATEDEGRQYQLRRTKDFSSEQIKMESMKMEPAIWQNTAERGAVLGLHWGRRQKNDCNFT